MVSRESQWEEVRKENTQMREWDRARAMGGSENYGKKQENTIQMRECNGKKHI